MADTAKKAVEQDGDQSMEEILSSIRRIIEEDGNSDGDDDAAQAAAGEESAGEETADAMEDDKMDKTPVEDEAAEEELELTDVVNEDGSVVNIKSQDEDDDILGNIDKAIGGQPVKDRRGNQNPDDQSLISQKAAEAATASIQSLVQSIPREEAAPSPRKTSPSPQFRSGTTVEDLVMEALRPMLKGWLDENLPIIVEAIVREEIKKLIDRGLA